MHTRDPNNDEIASDIFYPLREWPSYLVELFVLNNVAMYTYSQRNKICLFFWGNGATIEQMFTLSRMYSPPVKQTTYEERYQYDSSKRKCIGLFNTYVENRTNPQYAEKYYFYSMIEKRMLYIDGKARRYGARQN